MLDGGIMVIAKDTKRVAWFGKMCNGMGYGSEYWDFVWKYAVNRS